MFKSILTAAALVATAVTATAGTVTKNGNVLTLRGTVDKAMQSQWDKLFNNSITHIKLDSGGGSVYYGLMIAEDVYNARNRVVTEAIGGCQSMCAEIWLAADNHVFNSAGRIGFHLSYISDVQYWRDYQDKYGFNGLEWKFKKSTVTDLITTFKFFDNPVYFGQFMEGIKTSGLLGHQMWYPTNAELIRFEGGWTDAPVVETPVFKTFEKGYAITAPSTGRINRIADTFNTTIRITVGTAMKVRTAFYDASGTQLSIGYKIDDIAYGNIYQTYSSNHTGVSQTFTRYTDTKPAWMKIYSDDGLNVQWVKLS